MSVVVVLIGFALLVAGGFLGAFLWAVKTGQFEDRYTPSVRMLLDEPPPPGRLGGQTALPRRGHLRVFRNHHQQGS